MGLAQEIIQTFQNYLDSKELKIESSKNETKVNTSHMLHNKDLEEMIYKVLSATGCTLSTNMGVAAGKIEIQNGEITITSEQLDEYLEEYSME